MLNIKCIQKASFKKKVGNTFSNPEPFLHALKPSESLIIETFINSFMNNLT